MKTLTFISLMTTSVACLGSCTNPAASDAQQPWIVDRFDELEGQEVSIAGRMMSRRIMGKASFVHMMDGEGQIQAYVRREDVGEDVYADFKTMDIGDILGIEGVVFRTKTGEVSIHANSLTLLSKSLRVLPEKWNGLRDQDMRYRQRYVDTIVNPEVKDTFIKRSQILKALREFLDAKGFLEVDTPVLQTIEIGANSRSFVTHHNALDIPMYLRIETELYLKRLIVGGFFQGLRGRPHLPQRGHGYPPQPGIHLDRAVSGVCGLS